MTKSAPTTAELRRAGIITGPEIARAGILYQREPDGTYRFGSGHSLNLAAAIQAYAPARSALADPTASVNARRAVVINAIMLACPKAPRG